MVDEIDEAAAEELLPARRSKVASLAWIRSAYLCALGAAAGTGVVLVKDGTESTILIAFAANIAATLAIFICSRISRNSSFVDAYWSVAPPLIALFWALTPHSDDVSVLRRLVVMLLVFAWGIRLTYNWMRHWHGLGDEDWRYQDLREKWGRRFWMVDLGGIHLFQSVLVFLACLSLYPALSAGTRPLGALDLFALGVTSLGIWFEMTADRQLYEFVTTQKQPGQILAHGLWAYSCHPNYFGEILFWWGLYLFGLAADPAYWWTVIGPLGITLMFRFVSIPMINERSLARRPGYAEHMRRVNLCVPWLPRA